MESFFLQRPLYMHLAMFYFYFLILNSRSIRILLRKTFACLLTLIIKSGQVDPDKKIKALVQPKF